MREREHDPVRPGRQVRVVSGGKARKGLREWALGQAGRAAEDGAGSTAHRLAVPLSGRRRAARFGRTRWPPLAESAQAWSPGADETARLPGAAHAAGAARSLAVSPLPLPPRPALAGAGAPLAGMLVRGRARSPRGGSVGGLAAPAGAPAGALRSGAPGPGPARARSWG